MINHTNIKAKLDRRPAAVRLRGFFMRVFSCSRLPFVMDFLCGIRHLTNVFAFSLCLYEK